GSALADHVHRTTRLGTSVLTRGHWYKRYRSRLMAAIHETAENLHIVVSFSKEHHKRRCCTDGQSQQQIGEGC
ncbi:hypothetical protein, partial [Rhodovastum atsumiense]|uniref:hypothetical protein n=1 Tax=Rhodovastum atsumiense TaxID=504468 RepID=UPI00193B105E